MDSAIILISIQRNHAPLMQDFCHRWFASVQCRAKKLLLNFSPKTIDVTFSFHHFFIKHFKKDFWGRKGKKENEVCEMRFSDKEGNKVIKEIITFACRQSLYSVQYTFSESFCSYIAFKVFSPFLFWGWIANQIEASLVSRKLPSSRPFLIELTITNIWLLLIQLQMILNHNF